jgi:23S rRNA (pseudouridine1915-N3)-methyltransferase
MNYDIICVGSLKEKYWKDAVVEYSKRISAYGKVSVTEIKEAFLPPKASDAEVLAAITKEGEQLISKAQKNSFLVALDVKGKSLTSEGFAAQIQDLSLRGVSAMTFLIGGSMGLPEAVLAKCDARLSFSAFTFPHQMMRPILLEQIYRACKINSGETYHK